MLTFKISGDSYLSFESTASEDDAKLAEFMYKAVGSDE